MKRTTAAVRGRTPVNETTQQCWVRRRDSLSQTNICRMSSRAIEVGVVQITYSLVMCTYRRKSGMHHYSLLRLQSQGAVARDQVESDPGAKDQVESDPGPRVGVESDPGAKDQVEADPGPMVGVESDPVPRVGVESDPDPRVGVESDPGPRVGVESDPDPRVGVESDPGPWVGVESDAEAEMQVATTVGVMVLFSYQSKLLPISHNRGTLDQSLGPSLLQRRSPVRSM